MPVKTLLLHRDLFYHGGVARSFLSLARHCDPARLAVLAGSFLEPSDEMQAALSRRGVSVRVLGDNFVRAVMRLRRIIGRDRVEVIACASVRAYIVAKLSAAFQPCRVVFWVPSLPIWGSWVRRAVCRTLAVRDTLVSVSRAVEEAAGFVGHKGRSEVVYYGIEDPFSDPALCPCPISEREGFGIPRSARVLGYVAEFTGWKCHDVLLRAFARLSAEAPDLHLVLIGTGALLEKTRRLASQLPGSERVHFLGPRRDARRLLGLMDLYVHPADGEAFGLAVGEAMAAGIPLAAAASGALPEFIRHGDSGLLFPPHDDAALAECVRKLLDDPALRLKLAQRGREVCRETFAPSRFAEQMTAIIEQERAAAAWAPVVETRAFEAEIGRGPLA